MEPTEALESPASDAEASLSEPSEESASLPEQTDDISPASRDQMNALIRGLAGPLQADSASKPDGDEPDDDLDADPDGVSASSQEGVKPSEQTGQPKPGRRGAAAEIARLSGEVERLTKALDDLTPKAPDASEEARNAIVERENRYRRLLQKPWDDADWTQDDIDFFEGEKKTRALFPEMQQHYDTVLAEDRKALAAWAEQSVNDRWNAVKADLSTTLALPGVTPEIKAQLLKAPLSEQIMTHRRLERESIEPELKRLRDENADLRREMYGAVRAPLAGGRSSPGRTYDANDLMNDLIRGRRRSA